MQYTYVNAWCLGEMYVPLQQHWAVFLHFMQHFQVHSKQFSCWIGLLLVLSNISFLRCHFNC